MSSLHHMTLLVIGLQLHITCAYSAFCYRNNVLLWVTQMYRRMFNIKNVSLIAQCCRWWFKIEPKAFCFLAFEHMIDVWYPNLNSESLAPATHGLLLTPTGNGRRIGCGQQLKMMTSDDCLGPYALLPEIESQLFTIKEMFSVALIIIITFW